MFISLLPLKVENPELKRVLWNYFRIRSQKKKVAKSITVYKDAAERFGDE
ncbi:addiction module toxin RelE [Faecalibacterium sp. An122]|nr:addiction module toxin RelE [Faecalibacterium sp. An122]